MKPEFHPAAIIELEAAARIAQSRSPRLASELNAEVARVTDLLCRTPRMGEPLDATHRRFPLRRFPLALIYDVDGEALRIVAIAHRRQRPGYWRGRA